MFRCQVCKSPKAKPGKVNEVFDVGGRWVLVEGIPARPGLSSLRGGDLQPRNHGADPPDGPRGGNPGSGSEDRCF